MLSLESIVTDCNSCSTFFITLFEDNVMPELAEVTEIPMDGWNLYECHLLSPNTILYLGWDEDSKLPEWIESNDETYLQYFNHLVNGLIKSKSN